MEVGIISQENCEEPENIKLLQKRSCSLNDISNQILGKRETLVLEKINSKVRDVEEKKINPRAELRRPSSICLGLNASPALLSSPATPKGRDDKKQKDVDSTSPIRPRKLSVGMDASPFLRKESLTMRERNNSTSQTGEMIIRRPARVGSMSHTNERMDRRPATEGDDGIGGRPSAGNDTASCKPPYRRNTAQGRPGRPRIAARFSLVEHGQRLITAMLTPERGVAHNQSESPKVNGLRREEQE